MEQRLFLEDELDKGGIEIVADILVALLLQDKVVCSLLSNHNRTQKSKENTQKFEINKNENIIKSSTQINIDNISLTKHRKKRKPFTYKH